MTKTAVAEIAKFIGQYDKQLVSQVLNDLDFVKDMRVIRNASLNGTLLPKMTVAKGARPLDLNVTSRSGNHREFSGRKLYVYTGMKIISIIPEELERSFLSDMLEPGAKQIPFAQWIWMKEMEKLKSEINDNFYLSTYQGDAEEFDSGATYASGDYVKFGAELDIYKATASTTSGQSPTTHPSKWTKVNELVISDGPGTIIAAEISGSNLTPISTGALTSSNALDKIELIYNGMTPAHRKLGGELSLSHANYRNYLLHERSVFGNQATPDLANGPKTVYGDPKWIIKPRTWMGTSGRVIATQKDNMVFGTNIESDMGKIAKSVETLHGSDHVIKWRQGFEISDLETFYCNDQA